MIPQFIRELPEFPGLNEQARQEFGCDFDLSILRVWQERLVRCGFAGVNDLPLDQALKHIRVTMPPVGMFGTPGTMGELLRLLQIKEESETSPEIAMHARNRLEVVKNTEGYWRLVEYAKKTGLM